MRSMMRFFAPALPAVSLLSGCLALQESQNVAAVREREDILMLREDMAKVRGRVETLEMEYQQLGRELERLKSSVASESERRQRITDSRLADFEQRLQAADAAREKDKEWIVEQLSKKLAEIMARSAPAASSYSGPVKARHEVKPGETLSAIAQQYGVRVADITAANALSNPDMVRQGQVLIIPDR